jgi:hypothetical protein
VNFLNVLNVIQIFIWLIKPIIQAIAQIHVRIIFITKTENAKNVNGVAKYVLISLHVRNVLSQS